MDNPFKPPLAEVDDLAASTMFSALPESAEPRPPMPALPVSLRPATDDDLPYLLEVWGRSMHPHFAAAGLSPSEEDPLRRLSMRFECATMVLLEGRPVGLFKVARDGGNWKLIQVLLAPEVQRRGIGALLIRQLVDEARAQRASLNLSVLKCNPACRLYLRLGFAVVGEDQHAFEMRLGADAAQSRFSCL